MDAGNLFVYGRELRPNLLDNPEVVKKAVARAEIIAESFVRLGTQAVAVGGSDLGLGLPTLRDLAQRYRLPLISANLQDATGRLVFPGSRVVKIGGVTFGIIGLTGAHPVWRDVLSSAKAKLGDPVAAATGEVKTLKAKGAQFIVALAAVGFVEAGKIAEAVPGIDLMVISGTGRHMPNLERKGTTWLTESAREGKYIGQLTLHVRGDKLQFEDLSERFVLAERIESTEKNLKAMEARPAPRGGSGRPDGLAQRLQQMRLSVDSMREQLHKANQQAPQGSFVTNVMTPCLLTMPQDPQVVELIRTKAKAAGLQLPPGAI